MHGSPIKQLSALFPLEMSFAALATVLGDAATYFLT